MSGAAGRGDELAHPSQAAGRPAVVLGARVREFVADQAFVDRDDREGVDLLVGVDQARPCVVAVEAEIVGEIPGCLRVLQRVQGEEDRVVGLTRKGSPAPRRGRSAKWSRKRGRGLRRSMSSASDGR